MRRAIRLLCVFTLVGALLPTSAWAGSAASTSGGKASLGPRRSKSAALVATARPQLLVSKPADVINNVPGAAVVANTLVGSLDYETDMDDVYRVYLEKGSQLNLSLTADDGTDFMIFVFSPEATDVDTDAWVARSPGGYTYPQTASYTAEETGYYYVDLFAYDGWGNYSLTWSAGGAQNDNIPTSLASLSPVSDWLNWLSDRNDVYRVPLNAGDTLSVDLGSSAASCTSDFNPNLYLFGPGSTDISGPFVASSTGASYTEHLDYAAATAGDYFIDARTPTGAGATNVSWRVTPRMMPVITRTPSSSKFSVRRKRGKAKFTLIAQLTGANWLLVNYPMYLQYSKNGKSGWKTIGRGNTNSAGKVGFSVTQKKKGTYYFRWYAPAFTNTYSKASTTQRVTVK